jgi:hypothetical protein
MAWRYSKTRKGRIEGNVKMLEIELCPYAVEELIALINKQPAPLSWRMVDALYTLQDALDVYAEQQHSARYDYEGPRAEND